MKLYISNDKEYLSNLIVTYLKDLLINERADVILNGEKITGLIKDVVMNSKEDDHFTLYINEIEKQIPLFEDTKARLGRELVVFETKNHSTVIELL